MSAIPIDAKAAPSLALKWMPGDLASIDALPFTAVVTRARWKDGWSYQFKAAGRAAQR